MTCAFSKWCFDWSGHSQENSDAKPYSNSPFPKQMIQHRWCFPSRCHGCHREREICACGSPPLVLWSVLLVFLSHVGHAHVGVEPVDLAWLDVAEAEAETCHTFHLVDVHDLLYDPLRRKKKKNHTHGLTLLLRYWWVVYNYILKWHWWKFVEQLHMLYGWFMFFLFWETYPQKNKSCAQ